MKILTDNFVTNKSILFGRNVRNSAALLLAATGLILALPAHSATVFAHVATPLAGASTISSNAVTHPDGSDRDVTAYDNFTLSKSAKITRVTWRGSSADKGLAGFTIKIFASQANQAAQADTATPMAEIRLAGNAGEKPVEKNLSDYHADFSQPISLTGGVQYWISIVSNRNDLSPWGWAEGKGGDGKSIQSYNEFKILPAPGDRAFSLEDGQEPAK